MLNKKTNPLFILFSIIFFSCSANEEIDPSIDDAINQAVAYEAKEKRKEEIESQSSKSYSDEELKKKLLKMINDDQVNFENFKMLNIEIEKLDKRVSDLDSRINSDIEISKNNSPQISEDLLYRFNQRIKVLESKARYSDSLYFEMLNELVLIENKIISLNNSYNEANEINRLGRLETAASITNEEFRERYVLALQNYQVAKHQESINEFGFLISANPQHELSDNCQYWIAENYYALNNFEVAVSEFQKVFSFANTDKADDSYFKLGIIHEKLGNKGESKVNFEKLISYFPNSEYYIKAKGKLK